MAEINEQAYQDLRTYIQNNWKQLKLQDEEGNDVVTLQADDQRLTWVHAMKQEVVDYDEMYNPIYGDVPDSQTLTLQAIIKGADSDITAPVTITKSVVLNADNDALSSETLNPFTIESDEDELTVKHNIQVPQV